MPSTTEKGDQLRDYVIGTLEAEGHSIEREIRVDTKRVDVLLTLDDAFASRKIAVECKNVSRTTSQDDVVRIFADYQSLIERGLIDEVWIIVARHFSPEAQAWVKARSNCRAYTVSEFDERLNGFRRYANEVRGLFDEDGLANYYTQQRDTDGEPLRAKVFEWIDSSETRPLALLAGYGMGKTSFCRYLTRELANRYMENPHSRIPIYIRLSDIAREQELDGLVARTLAGRYHVQNYHFHKFERLNRDGRFVIIFDGFDEMKFALSWSEFLYNFSEINRAVSGRAKVIVAGRPNAFLSDDEHSWVLRGTRSHGGDRVSIPGAPKYIEVELEAFGESEAREFVKRYLTVHPPAPTEVAVEELDGWIEKRIEAFEKLRTKSDLRRPVHLKIFSDVARDPEAKLDGLNIYDLYNAAAMRIVGRDTEKPQRKPINADLRQQAIEDVAWWLWEQSAGRSLSFSPKDVPSSYVSQAFDPVDRPGRDEMFREVFSGPFFDRKFGEQYYFSHRSFIEFFVAKRLGAAAEHGFNLGVISNNINPEILNFIKESGRYASLMSYVLEKAQSFVGELDAYFLNEIVMRAKREDSGRLQSGVYLISRYFGIYDGSMLNPAEIISLLKEDFASSQQEVCEGALFFGMDFVRLFAGSEQADEVMGFIAAYCAGKVNWKARELAFDETLSMPRFSFSRNNLFEFAFLRAARVQAEHSSAGQAIVSIDIEHLYSDLYATRRPKIVPTGREPANVVRPRHSISFKDLHIGASVRDAALAVLRRGVGSRLVR